MEVVNPAILSAAGVPFHQVFMATIISSVIGTLFMALLSKHPIAIAPGIAVGFIAYPLMKLAMGKGKEVHPLLYVFGVILILQPAFFPVN